ncbi:unnamed protein product [Pedinophyceae sp. YPF-701]|nr:unnamed protein product [Pedinophyceae sp. YPF-701]
MTCAMSAPARLMLQECRRQPGFRAAGLERPRCTPAAHRNAVFSRRGSCGRALRGVLRRGRATAASHSTGSGEGASARAASWQELCGAVAELPCNEFSELTRDVGPVEHTRVPRFLVPPGDTPDAPAASPADERITWTTQVSLDRWDCIVRLANAWSGPLSVAVHIPSPPSDARACARHLAQLRAAFDELPPGHSVTVSVLHAPDPAPGDAEGPASYRASYPINALRNLAIEAAATDLVVLADGDLVPSAGLEERLAGVLAAGGAMSQPTHSRERGRATVAVVPAFECADGEDGLPRTREELAARRAVPFQCSSATEGADSGPIDYDRWWAAEEPYAAAFREFFEPVLAGRRSELPGYSELFRGYGLNKVQLTTHLAELGTCFQVVPRGFVACAPHPPSASRRAVLGADARSRNRLRVAALYVRWRLHVAAIGPSCAAALSRPGAQLLMPDASPVQYESEPVLEPEAGGEAGGVCGPDSRMEEGPGELWRELRERSGSAGRTSAWVAWAGVDDLGWLAEAVRRWDGPMAAAVFVPAPRLSPPGKMMAQVVRAWCKEHLRSGQAAVTIVFGNRYTEEGMRALAAAGLDTTISPSRQNSYADAFPVAALWNAAIAASPSDAVVLAGPGLLPTPGLSRAVSAALTQAAQNSPAARTILALPIAERAGGVAAAADGPLAARWAAAAPGETLDMRPGDFGSRLVFAGMRSAMPRFDERVRGRSGPARHAAHMLMALAVQEGGYAVRLLGGARVAPTESGGGVFEALRGIEGAAGSREALWAAAIYARGAEEMARAREAQRREQSTTPLA